jgi:hypothetical protein
MIVQSGNVKELQSVSGYLIRNFQGVSNQLLWLCLWNVSTDKAACREINIYLVRPKFQSANFSCAPHFPQVRQINIHTMNISQIGTQDAIDILFEGDGSISICCDGGAFLIAEFPLHES